MEKAHGKPCDQNNQSTYITSSSSLSSERFRSNEGLTLETSAFKSLYEGQFTLSTQLIKPNYLEGRVLSKKATNFSLSTLRADLELLVTVCPYMTGCWNHNNFFLNKNVPNVYKVLSVCVHITCIVSHI